MGDRHRLDDKWSEDDGFKGERNTVINYVKITQSELDARNAHITELEAEAKKQAAWACIYPDGKEGLTYDDWGHASCNKDVKIAKLEAALAKVTAQWDGLGVVLSKYLKHEPPVTGKDKATIEEFIAAIKDAEQPCTHAGYNFTEHGRCCPHCSAFVTDFGD